MQERTTRTSAGKLASNAKHLEKLDQIMVRPGKEEGAEIRAAAVESGQSLQAYVLQAIRERMQREQAQKQK